MHFKSFAGRVIRKVKGQNISLHQETAINTKYLANGCI